MTSVRLRSRHGGGNGMNYLILGAVALIVLLAFQGRTRAKPAQAAKVIRYAAGVVALVGAGVLAFRGAISVAAPLAMLGSWLLWGQSALSWGGLGPARPQPGQSSRVTTDHLDVALDHETGKLTGRVLKGLFKGRALAQLSPAEVALLWQDCRFTDPASAQILETYLDGRHPSWREDLARGEREMSGPDGRVSLEEAYEILGLQPGAGEDDIRRAHRELMLKLHPDRGGSNYLAAKINEAKEVALEHSPKT